jgi:hypothetical protein
MFAKIMLMAFAMLFASVAMAAHTTVTIEYFTKGTNCTGAPLSKHVHQLNVCEGQNMYVEASGLQVWNKKYTPSVNACGVFSGENDCYWVNICQSGYYANTDDDLFVTVA